MLVDAKHDATVAQKRAPEVKRLIKLGGAAITVKSGLEVPRSEVIQAAAQHVAETVKHLSLSTPGRPAGCVLVHGAGSFGHPQAVQHGVVQGWRMHKACPEAAASVQQGFTVTRASVTKLNALVVNALIQGKALQGTVKHV